MKLVAMFAAVAIGAGCSTSQAFIKMSDFSAYTADNPGNKEFEEIGKVRGSAWSWTWADCDELAKEAMTELLASAKKQGGDAVYGVRFMNGSKVSDGPECKRYWGLLLFAVPIPATISVTGTAAKAHAGARTSGLDIDLRDNRSAEELAAEYLARLP